MQSKIQVQLSSWLTISMNSNSPGSCSTVVHTLWKKSAYSGPMKFKLMLFKGQLYFKSVSLCLKRISCKQHILRSFCLLLSTLTICFLIGTVRPLMFKVIIDIIGLIFTIFLNVFYLLPLFLFLFLCVFCQFNWVFNSIFSIFFFFNVYI